MSESQSSWIAKWLPLIVALVGQGAFYGTTRSEIEHLKESDAQIRQELMPLPQRMQFFLPRSEFNFRMDAYDLRLGRIETLVSDTNNRLTKALALHP